MDTERLAADPPPVGADDFARWVEPALLPMTRLAARLAPHAEPADVVQDALARAWRKRASFDADRGTPTTWLLAITADQARAARRRRRRWLGRLAEDAEVPDRPDPAPEPDLDLERAIAGLAARQQLAVHLHYFVGLPLAEVAAVMACSEGTVKSTLFDARARLRRRLEDPDDD